MSAKTPTPENIQHVMTLVHDALDGAIKLAADREVENEALRSKIAAMEATPPKQVVLEKVASLNGAKIARVLERLVQADMLGEDGREKIASGLINDPNLALDLVERVLDVKHSPAAPSGHGVPKTAGTAENTRKSDLEKWLIV